MRGDEVQGPYKKTIKSGSTWKICQKGMGWYLAGDQLEICWKLYKIFSDSYSIKSISMGRELIILSLVSFVSWINFVSVYKVK